MSDSFTEIAPFYEDLMDGVPYVMWVSYLKLLFAQFDVRPQKLLEVCCGTGTMSRMLANMGYSVTGIDLSHCMIREARKLAKKEELQIEFKCQDASQLRLSEKFDAAFSFFDSFNYIATAENCRRAIASVSKALVPGGLFAFDLNTQYAFVKKMFDQSDMKPSSKVRYDWRSNYDKQQRICTVEMDFWANGEHVHETHVQRAHSIEELQLWMSEAGFINVRFYDAYTLDPVRGRSDRMHVVGILAS